MVKSTNLCLPPSLTGPVALSTSPRLYSSIYKTELLMELWSESKAWCRIRAHNYQKKKVLDHFIDVFAAFNNLTQICTKFVQNYKSNTK